MSVLTSVGVSILSASVLLVEVSADLDRAINQQMDLWQRKSV